jgi:hypothetical protein
VTVDNPRRALRIVVYVLLLSSAATTFFFGERLWAAVESGELPLWVPLMAPGAFTLFVAVYTLDRWMLVRRRASSLGRALLQVAFAMVFMTLLWPQQTTRFREARRAAHGVDDVVRLLEHGDPDVRAAGCELVGWRAETDRYAAIDTLANHDPSPRVRGVCREALTRLSAALTQPPSGTALP